MMKACADSELTWNELHIGATLHFLIRNGYLKCDHKDVNMHLLDKKRKVNTKEELETLKKQGEIREICNRCGMSMRFLKFIERKELSGKRG